MSSLLQKIAYLLERGLPAKTDDAVYLIDRIDAFAGKRRSNRLTPRCIIPAKSATIPAFAPIKRPCAPDDRSNALD
ncbi:hypothetical protein ACTUVN_003798 [Pseudomonas caspiana]